MRGLGEVGVRFAVSGEERAEPRGDVSEVESRHSAHGASTVLADYLEGHDTSAGLDHSCHLSECPGNVYEVPDAEADGGTDEAVVREGKIVGVSLNERDGAADSLTFGFFDSKLHHLAGEIESDDGRDFGPSG